MSLFLLIILAVFSLAHLFATLRLWGLVNGLDVKLRQQSTTVQRQEREITQQRYAIAMLRQLQKGEEGAEAKSDEQRLNEAVTHLDEAAAAAEVPKQDAATAAGQAPTHKDKAVGGLKEAEILQFVKHAVKNNQIAVSKQPIVALPKRQVRYFEIFSRIQVGDQGFIPAHKFISIARSNNLMGVLDNLLLLRCLQMIKQSGEGDGSVGYFVNISVATLGSKNYINDLTEFLAANPKLSARLVFEMTQEDTTKITPTVKSVMDGLSLLGCRFSMDQVKVFGIDVDRLANNNISFVKMDGRALQKEVGDPSARGRMKRIKAQLEAQGIEVIVEKIEKETQLLDLVGLYVNYGQGYLFGQPEVLA
jgi:cyclic-di-GMP phosphodiesterase TipF (flagellum assembly factor)